MMSLATPNINFGIEIFSHRSSNKHPWMLGKDFHMSNASIASGDENLEVCRKVTLEPISSVSQMPKDEEYVRILSCGIVKKL
jgi:hypothetical protein